MRMSLHVCIGVCVCYARNHVGLRVEGDVILFGCAVCVV